jgi:hypothetical protein
MMRPISDRTLAELLARRLRSVGAFQLFLRKLGAKDVVYLSAQAFRSDGVLVEARATAMELPDALVALLANLDEATAAELDQDLEPEPEPEPRRKRSIAVAAPVHEQLGERKSGIERCRRVALTRVARLGAVSVEALVEELGAQREEVRQVLDELVAAGELERSPRYGYVAPTSTTTTTTDEEP